MTALNQPWYDPLPANAQVTYVDTAKGRFYTIAGYGSSYNLATLVSAYKQSNTSNKTNLPLFVPEFHDKFNSRSDGTFTAGMTSESGQKWLFNPSSYPTTIMGGRVYQLATGFSYHGVVLENPVTYMSASFGFYDAGGGAGSNSFTLCAFNANGYNGSASIGVLDCSAHLVVTPSNWSFDVFSDFSGQGNFLIQLSGGNTNFAAGEDLHTSELFIDPDKGDWYVRLDGGKIERSGRSDYCKQDCRYAVYETGVTSNSVYLPYWNNPRADSRSNAWTYFM